MDMNEGMRVMEPFAWHHLPGGVPQGSSVLRAVKRYHEVAALYESPRDSHTDASIPLRRRSSGWGRAGRYARDTLHLGGAKEVRLSREAQGRQNHM